MPSIENLRKQAKLYVRWHREGYYPVAAQIRSVLARYRGLSDRQILDLTFRLNDAQELVAKRSGFENWLALIKEAQTMTPPAVSVGTTSVIVAAEPQLFVSDIDAACKFYTCKLGFRVGFSYGEPPFYA